MIMPNDDLLATCVRRIWPSEIEVLLPAFVTVLRESVNDGSPLGFVPPITATQARDYWLSRRPELYAGSRVLLGRVRRAPRHRIRPATVSNGA